MSDPRDRHSTSHQTIPDSRDVLASPASSSQPQLTIDPVTMRAGSPGRPPSSQNRVDPYLGKTLEGRYAIEALLGEGGMGFVYLGRHKLIDKRVAIKILRSDLAADAEMTERFLNEARAASSIGSPHIVDISDFGRLPDGAAYFVMEFLDGVPLSSISGDGKVVPAARLVHVAKQIARGLGVAHSRGVVHRDLKPDNVMLIQRGDDRDFVKILDFGIAKLQGEQAKLTRAGSVFGTPHYMSPEQAAGVPVDHRTDIYSLGVMLYEMAVGRVPFDADNFMGILTQHMYKAPAPMRVVALPGYDLPAGLEAIIFKALSKKPELRYATMEEMIGELDKVERGIAPEAFVEITSRSDLYNIPADYFQNPTSVGATGRSSQRGTLTMIGLAGGFLGIAIVGVLMITGALRPKPPPVASAPEVASPAASGLAVELPANPPATKIAVLVTGEPADALITLEDDPQDKGEQQPRTLMVGPDEKVNIRVQAKDHLAKRITVDSKKQRVVFHLESRPGTAAPPKPALGRGPQSVAKPVPSAAPAQAPAPKTERCAEGEWMDPYEHKCVKRTH